jgi:hypothetical protein
MKMLTACLALWFAASAVAQSADPAATTAGPARRRAPLGNVADLEPAVNVGAPQVAAVARPVAPTAVAPARPAVPATPIAPGTGASRAMDSLDLGTTSITGNQELPKVLYIVPWKKSDLGDLVGRPVNTLLDEVLAPVDPDVFERHLHYYEALNGDKQGVR